jgi:four helix bundle protein
MELADTVYALTTAFPSDERYGLAAQMCRAAVSVASNVAEGAARASNAEFLRFLHAARGSLAELDTQIEIARRRGYLNQEGLRSAGRLIEEVGKTLQGLIARRKRIAMEQEATGRR